MIWPVHPRISWIVFHERASLLRFEARLVCVLTALRGGWPSHPICQASTRYFIFPGTLLNNLHTNPHILIMMDPTSSIKLLPWTKLPHIALKFMSSDAISAGGCP